MLVAHGANLDQRNHCGQTAASLTAHKAYIDLLLCLVRQGVGGIADVEWRRWMDVCKRV
jgi:hypothetical protein